MSNVNNTLLSIVTPTYNRVHTLGRLYKSLCTQTEKKFEWVVIDDGSVDETEVEINKWIENNNDFDIIYHKQSNGGKHRALNSGIRIANHDFIYIVDSDDYLTVDAVEFIYTWISTINNDYKFAGVAGLRGNSPHGEIIGQFPENKEYVDAKNTDRGKRNLLGDKAEIYRTELLKKYPFPEFEGEKFLSEVAVWNKIAGDGYLIRWFNKVICICDYLEDGLTKNMSSQFLKGNYNGYTYTTKINFLTQPFPYKYLSMGIYIEVSHQIGYDTKTIMKNTGISNFDFLISVIVKKIHQITKNARE